MTRSALGWLNLVLPKDRVGQVTSDVVYGDHMRHRLDIYSPRKADAAQPVVMFIYGGGWRDGSRAEYEFAGRAFAAAGFVTLVPDYRLVPEVHFPEFIEDLGLALKWAEDNASSFGGDMSRVFFVGHSAGAYNAMMLAFDGKRFGAPDLAERLRGVIGLSGPYDFYPFDVAASINTFARFKEPELTQPVHVAHGSAPPVMLAHGKPDTTCGVYNSQNLAKRLKQSGVEAVEHYYDGVGHPHTLLALFPWLRWRLPVYRQALAFMNARL